MNLDSYRNQVVMITGAASGFGALLAERLAGLGARLVLGERIGRAQMAGLGLAMVAVSLLALG